MRFFYSTLNETQDLIIFKIDLTIRLLIARKKKEKIKIFLLSNSSL